MLLALLKTSLKAGDSHAGNDAGAVPPLWASQATGQRPQGGQGKAARNGLETHPGVGNEFTSCWQQLGFSPGQGGIYDHLVYTLFYWWVTITDIFRYWRG